MGMNAMDENAVPQCPETETARRKFDELENWLYSGQASLLDMKSVEVGMEAHGRELLRQMLQAHINRRGNGDIGPGITAFTGANAGKGIRHSHKRVRSRNIMTIFGRVTVSRMGYGMPGKPSVHPMDAQLCLPARSFSYELQRRLVKMAVQVPFDKAVDLLRETTGATLAKRSAEQVVIDAAVDFDAFYTGRGPASVCSAGRILIGSIDCKGIPMVKPEPSIRKSRGRKGEKANKKKMATVAAVFAKPPLVRTPAEVIASLFDPSPAENRKKDVKPENKRVWASLTAGKDAFVTDVRDEMQRRDPLRERPWVIVTDGERALQLRAAREMKHATLVLDFFHALEKLWAAAHAVHGEGTSEAEDFVRARALRILSGDVSQVVKGLRQTVTKRKLKSEKRKTLLGAANYFFRNKSRMRYNEYLERGLPIGSGTVEGTCKNLVKDRMELSGMRWTPPMAEAMLKLRALCLSDDLEEYWKFHVGQEQQRLYSCVTWHPIFPSS